MVLERQSNILTRLSYTVSLHHDLFIFRIREQIQFYPLRYTVLALFSCLSVLCKKNILVLSMSLLEFLERIPPRDDIGSCLELGPSTRIRKGDLL